MVDTVKTTVAHLEDLVHKQQERETRHRDRVSEWQRKVPLFRLLSARDSVCMRVHVYACVCMCVHVCACVCIILYTLAAKILVADHPSACVLLLTRVRPLLIAGRC